MSYHDPTADAATNIAAIAKSVKEKMPNCDECNSPTDKTYFKRPLCESCKMKVEKWRNENGRKTKQTKWAKRHYVAVKN